MARKTARRGLDLATIEGPAATSFRVLTDEMAPRFEIGDTVVAVPVRGADAPLIPGSDVVVRLRGDANVRMRTFAGRLPDGRWQFISRLPPAVEVYFPDQVVEVLRVVMVWMDGAFR